MIELLKNLKLFCTFHLNPIRELVRYNEKFQPQEVVVKFVKEIVGDSCAWTFFGFFFHCNILYFVHVNSSLSHIVRPHLYIKVSIWPYFFLIVNSLVHFRFLPKN